MSVVDHCLRSRDYVNVVVAGKHSLPQWLTMDEAVLHGLFQVAPRGAQLRQPVDHVLDEVEPVEAVLHPQVERGGDRALLFVAADVEVLVRSTVGEAVDQPGVAVKAEDDVFVLGED